MKNVLTSDELMNMTFTMSSQLTYFSYFIVYFYTVAYFVLYCTFVYCTFYFTVYSISLMTSQGSDTVTSIFKWNSSNTIINLRLLKMA